MKRFYGVGLLQNNTTQFQRGSVTVVQTVLRAAVADLEGMGEVGPRVHLNQWSVTNPLSKSQIRSK